MIYMVLGGYTAVSYNDAVRSVIMIFGLVIFPAYGLVKIGGFQMMLDTLRSLNPALIDPFSLGAGMISGTLVTIFWKLFLKEATGIYELIPAFLCSAIMVVGVSLLTRRTALKEK